MPNPVLAQAMDALTTNRPAAAVGLLEPYTAEHSNDTEAFFLLGYANLLSGRLGEALSAAARAVELQPNAARHHHVLGEVHSALDEHEAALRCFSKACELDPKFVPAWGLRGYTLACLGQVRQAVSAWEKAVSLDPANSDVLANLAKAHLDLGHFAHAWQLCQECLRRGLRSPQVLSTHALLLEKQGRIADAVAAFRQHVAAEPRNAIAFANLLLALHHDPDAAPDTVYSAHIEWARRFEDPIPQLPPVPRDTRTSPPLRVGYVSPDFCTHAVASFFEPLLRAHDHTALRLVAYSNTSRCDEMTENFKKLFHVWRDVQTLSDDALAAQIRQDQIDILVDLAGHTEGNRLLAFARRPAPIQVTYLGYPGTTGMSRIDCRITDALTDPPGQEAFYTESLIRLPTTFFRFAPPPQAPAPLPSPARTTGRLTFGAFHRLPKLNPQTISLWSKLLHGVPNSRLLIYRNNLIPSHQPYFRELFRRNHIPDERVIMQHEFPQTPHGHFDAYSQVDIHLDTLPWNAHTILCELLCAGIPTITLAGSRHASRLAMAALTAVGLDRFVAPDEAGFIQIGRYWSTRLDELAALRAALPGMLATAPLTEPTSLARAIEAVYRDLFTRWQQS